MSHHQAGPGHRARRQADGAAHEAEANATDWILTRIPSPARRKTLIARKEAGEVPRYVLDIRLQGEHETVFFDL